MAVHELRIHGVNNTPPHDMLCLEPDEVRPVAGGDPTTFYAAKAPALPKGLASREAYSWGNMTSAPGSTGKMAIGALSRAAWLLLVPFAFVNVGYWARPGLRPSAGAGDPRFGAAVFRVAGLLMTALFVTVAAGIGIDQLAWQCFRDGTEHCAVLPSWAGFLADGSWNEPARRIGVGTLVPLTVVLALWLLSRTTMQRYEQFPDVGDDTSDRHVLERAGFWNGRNRVLRLQRLHLAVAVAVVVVLTALPFTQRPAQGARGPYAWPLANLVLAVAVLAAAIVVACVQVADAPEYPDEVTGERAPGHVLRAGLVVLASQVLALLVPGYELVDDGNLYGSGAAPLLLLVALCALAFVAFVPERMQRGVAVAVAVATVVLALAYARADGEGDFVGGVAATVGGGIVVIAWVVHRAFRARGAAGRTRAWGGAAPALFLAAGVFFAALYGTAATLSVADRLNGGAALTELSAKVGSRPGTTATCETATFTEDKVDVACTRAEAKHQSHTVPVVYFWLAFGLLATLVAWFVTLVFAIVAKFRRSGVFRAIPDRTRAYYNVTDPLGEYQCGRVAGARRSAALSHRAERLISLIAPATALVFVVAVGFSVPAKEPWRSGGVVRIAEKKLIYVGLYVAIGAAAAIVGLGALAYRSASARRTVGILWDLSSFWPRAAHPFAPPCYAERAVPDLVVRARWRLAGNDRLILSAHSLGCLLAVATVFRLPPADRARVTLLTYGCQLRAYFSRIFPAVFGPDVLGTAPATQPQLTRDVDDGTVPAPATSGSVAAQVRAWRNLWRPSDYLGFRVYAAGVDVQVRETLIPWAPGNPEPPEVRTHGDYPCPFGLDAPGYVEPPTDYDTVLATLIP